VARIAIDLGQTQFACSHRDYSAYPARLIAVTLIQRIGNHQWAVINDTLRVLVRKSQGKRSRPTAANLDNQSVKSVGHGGRVLGWFTWLRILWVDGGYLGETFAQCVKGLRPKLAIEVVKRFESSAGFKVLPLRWVVERTFGWLML
jgi:transposase